MGRNGKNKAHRGKWYTHPDKRADSKKKTTVVKAKSKPKPEARLVIPRDEYDKFTDYIRLCDAEFGMFGYVKLVMDDIHPTFVVDTLFLAPQEVSGTSVDYESEGFEYAIEKAIEDGRIEDLRFSCHSHVDMGAYWSGTDEDFIRNMNNGAPWHVSLVQNRAGNYEARADFYNPGGDIGKFMKQIRQDLKLYIDGKNSVDEQRKTELAKFVKEKKWETAAYGGYGGRIINSPKSDTKPKSTRAEGKAAKPAKSSESTKASGIPLRESELRRAGFEPDWLDMPDDIDDGGWGWHEDYGWVQREGSDITAVWQEGIISVIIPGAADDVDWFEEESEATDREETLEEKADRLIGKMNDDPDEGFGEIISDELVKAVMERGQE